MTAPCDRLLDQANRPRPDEAAAAESRGDRQPLGPCIENDKRAAKHVGVVLQPDDPSEGLGQELSRTP